jgi:hypothetical protein
MRDLETWKGLAVCESEGRPILPLSTDGILHTDAADVGYGGTLSTSGNPGGDGVWKEQGVWAWTDREESISVRELRAVRLLLQGTLGYQSRAAGMKLLRLCMDNAACVHVTRAFVSASAPMMRELRRLKRVLDDSGLAIRSDWLPSAANKFSDALSRRLSASDITARRTLLQSVADGLRAPAGRFSNRIRLGETPWFARKRAVEELSEKWPRDEIRVLCPPVDLLPAILRKLAATGAPAVLLHPDWPAQAWHSRALRQATRTRVLELPAAECWTGHRRINEAWRMRISEFNMN